MSRRRPSRQRQTYSVREKCERFVAAVKELSDHPYWQSDFTPSFNVRMEAEGEWIYTVAEPDLTQLESFVMRLRVLVSDEEPVFVNHIRGLVRPRLRDEQLVRDLDFVYDDWRAALNGAGIRLVLNDRPISPEEAWHLYMNSYFAHLDLDKRKVLEGHEAQGTAWMFRARFLEHVHYAAQYVIGIGIVVRQALERGELDLSEGPELAHS